MKLPDIVQLDKRGRHWRLQKAYTAKIGLNWSVRVPAGFVTDLASIPAFARPVIGGPVRFSGPAIIHDHLCRKCNGNYDDRLLADAAFLALLRRWNVPRWRRLAMFIALRVWAWSGCWKKDCE